MKKYTPKNVILMLLGVIFVGLGVGLLNQSNFGVDPFSCMNYGVSSVLGLSFGTYQLIINTVLFILMLFIGRKHIGIGTFGNMILVGYVADFVQFVFNLLGFEDVTYMVARIVLLIVGVVVTCFGVGLYSEMALGISPYDALAYIIEDGIHGKVKFKWLRILTDIICVSVGFITGSTIGVGTVIMMFFTGPLVQFFRDLLSPIFKNKDNDTNINDTNINENIIA